MKILFAFATGLLGTVAHAWSGVSFASYDFTGSDGRHLTLGYAFTANQAAEVSALGAFDHLGDGFAEEHQVGLWDLSGLVRVATVPAGAASFRDGFFRYAAIEPLTLVPGRQYIVGAFYRAQGPDLWTWGTPPTNYQGWQVAPEITFNVGMYAYDAFTAPNQITWPYYGGGNVFFGAVPEPASILAIGVGLAAIIRKRRGR